MNFERDESFKDRGFDGDGCFNGCSNGGAVGDGRFGALSMIRLCCKMGAKMEMV